MGLVLRAHTGHTGCSMAPASVGGRACCGRATLLEHECTAVQSHVLCARRLVNSTAQDGGTLDVVLAGSPRFTCRPLPSCPSVCLSAAAAGSSGGVALHAQAAWDDEVHRAGTRRARGWCMGQIMCDMRVDEGSTPRERTRPTNKERPRRGHPQRAIAPSVPNAFRSLIPQPPLFGCGRGSAAVWRVVPAAEERLRR